MAGRHPVDSLIFSITTGFALGLASTLHCAGMCGAISSSLLLAGGQISSADASRRLVLTHAGRIASYALAGALVGAIGAPIVSWLDREIAFRMIQWAGAVALMWIGMSTAGLLPPMSRVDRVLAPLASALARTTRGVRHPALAPLAAGLTWGLMPCAMVYGALFMSLITGAAAHGALVMLAFGAGTLPALLAASFGVRALAAAGEHQALRTTAGLAIAALAVASIWLPHPINDTICTDTERTAALQIIDTNADR